jgi:signal peptidase II
MSDGDVIPHGGDEAFVALTPRAQALHTLALQLSLDSPHPGFITDHHLQEIDGNPAPVIDELVRKGIWEKHNHGYLLISARVARRVLTLVAKQQQNTGACAARTHLPDRDGQICARCGAPLTDTHGDDEMAASTPTETSSTGPSQSRLRHRSRTLAGLAVSAAALLAYGADQLTKAWALDALAGGTIIPLLPSVRFELYYNPGVAFGIGSEAGAPLVIALLVIVAGLIGWITARIVRRAPTLPTIFFALATGGAAGNLWDRISRAEDGPLTGMVVDFIAVEWFAIFNTADIFTTGGIIAGAITIMLTSRTQGEHR